MISHKSLLCILHYDPETGIFRWRVSYGKVREGTEAGSYNGGGYRVIRIDGKLYMAHRLAWFYTHSEWPPNQIDHINGVRDDNRIVNLRTATNTENSRNRGISKNNTSGIPGVYFFPRRSLWTAEIKVNRKKISLGYFQTIEAAAEARKKAEEKYGYTVRNSR